MALHAANFRSAGALWRDEVVTYQVATMPTLAELWHSIPYDSFPGAVHLMLRFWTSLWGSEDDAGLRIFGGVMGLAVIAALWVSGRLLGAAWPVLSLTLLGLSPAVIRYGDSIRAYGLGMVAIVLTFGLIWTLTRRPTLPFIVIAGVAAIISVQTLYQNLAFLASICVAGLVVTAWRKEWPRAFVIAAIGSVAAASLVPYRGLLSRAAEIKQVLQFDVTIAGLLDVFLRTLGTPLNFLRWVWIALLVAGIGVALLANWPRRVPRVLDDEHGVTLFCGTAMITGMVAFVVFMKLLPLPSQPWHYIPLMAFIIVSLEGIFSVIRRGTTARYAILAATVGFIGVVIVPAWAGVQVRQTNIDLIAKQLEMAAAAQDVILVNPWYCGATFQRYYRGTTMWTTLPPHDDLKLQRKDIFKERMLEPDPIRPVIEVVSSALKAGHRVWLVGGLPVPAPGTLPPAAPPAPQAPWGWDHGAYAYVWGLHVGHLLQTRANHASGMPRVFEGAVNPYENLPVIMVQGWRGE